MALKDTILEQGNSGKELVIRFDFKDFFTMVQQRPPPLPVAQGVLIIEASRSHLDTRTTVGRTPLDEGSDHRRNL